MNGLQHNIDTFRKHSKTTTTQGVYHNRKKDVCDSEKGNSNKSPPALFGRASKTVKRKRHEVDISPSNEDAKAVPLPLETSGRWPIYSSCDEKKLGLLSSYLAKEGNLSESGINIANIPLEELPHPNKLRSNCRTKEAGPKSSRRCQGMDVDGYLAKLKKRQPAYSPYNPTKRHTGTNDSKPESSFKLDNPERGALAYPNSTVTKQLSLGEESVLTTLERRLGLVQNEQTDVWSNLCAQPAASLKSIDSACGRDYHNQNPLYPLFGPREGSEANTRCQQPQIMKYLNSEYYELMAKYDDPLPPDFLVDSTTGSRMTVYNRYSNQHSQIGDRETDSYYNEKDWRQFDVEDGNLNQHGGIVAHPDCLHSYNWEQQCTKTNQNNTKSGFDCCYLNWDVYSQHADTRNIGSNENIPGLYLTERKPRKRSGKHQKIA